MDIRRDRWGRYLVVPPEGGKPVGYTRATTVAKTLDDGGGLMPWKATMAVTGLLRRPGLRARWEALLAAHAHTGPWYGSEEAKAECKRLVEECAEAGGSADRADIGTALHAIAEQHDLGFAPHITQPETRADLDAYVATCAAAGLTFDQALIEATVVLDGWQVAGTADRLVAHLPGHHPMVADLKTGTDLRYGWQAIAVQLAIYAHGDAVYVQGDAADGSRDVRHAVPAVSQTHALVIHLPAGEARCELHVVDIAAGWEAFERSMWARRWRARKDLAESLPVERPADTAPGNHVGPDGGDPSGPTTIAHQRAANQRGFLLARMERLYADCGDPFVAALGRLWPLGVPTFKTAHQHSLVELERIAVAVTAAAAEVSAPFRADDRSPASPSPSGEAPPAPGPSRRSGVNVGVSEGREGGAPVDPFDGINGEAPKMADPADCEALIAFLRTLPAQHLAELTAKLKAVGVPNLRSGHVTALHVDQVLDALADRYGTRLTVSFDADGRMHLAASPAA